MINFIVTLEQALINAGVEYEIRYLPHDGVYVLSIDGTEAFVIGIDDKTSKEIEK